MLELTAAAKTEGDERKIKEIRAIPDGNSQDAYYIVNYEKGGFMIISADNRVEPVLAYSEDNEFPLEAEFSLDSEHFPPTLAGWLHDVKHRIETVRATNETQSDNMARAWNVCHMRASLRLEDCCANQDCENECLREGPLLSTVWHQGCGYNDQMPACATGFCGNAYTGCVATAMAQIMYYHKRPINYNWDNMTRYSANIYQLMADIGQSVDMDYSGCPGPSLAYVNKVESAFKDTFNYSSATYMNSFNLNTVKSQLDQKQPVILSGVKTNNYRHAWICDGYQGTRYCENGSEYVDFLSMNWGWINANFNGWFSAYDFNPSGTSYNSNKTMVYDIKP